MKHTMIALVCLALMGCVTTDSENVSGWSFHVDNYSSHGSHSYNVATKSKGHPVRSGETSMRFEVRKGECGISQWWNDCAKHRQRSELNQNGYEYGETWYHHSLYIPEEYAPVIASGSPMLGQWHYYREDIHGRGGVPIRFKLMAIRIPNTKKYDYAYVIEPMFGRTRILSTLDDMKGKWTDVLVHANWTTKEDGVFRVYVNGNTEPAFTYSGPTKLRGFDVFFKFGIYRGENDDTQVVYYDDVRKGGRCEEVGMYFDCSKLMVE